MNNNFKVGQDISLEVTEINHNHLVVGNDKTDAFLYQKEMPKVTVELIIVDDSDKKIVLLEEDIGGDSKLVLPGGTLQPDEASGETGVRLLKEYVGVDYETGDLELYDFRTNPGRDDRQWLVSVIYIARIQDKGEDYWANIRDVILHEDDFGYDHHRILQNFEYNC